jgi:hypothetical protein
MNNKHLDNHLDNHLDAPAIIIQRTWRKYLKARYKHLGLCNIDDCDPATLAEIRLIPKTDLYIYLDVNGNARGGDIFQFLQWISKFSYLETPINYNRIKLTPDEVEWFINHGRKIVNIKKFSNNPDNNTCIRTEWTTLINNIENTHMDRMNPERVYTRLLNSRDQYIARLLSAHKQWKYLITYENLERYLESILKNSYTVPDDLDTIIQNIPLQELYNFQNIWKNITYYKKEIQNFEYIFFNNS